jgi:hypothetical protein
MFRPAHRRRRRRLGNILSSPYTARGDPVIREAKLVGFALLLAAIFVGAHAAGAHLGPVTTSHVQVSYPGLGNMGGMNMGGSGPGGGQGPAPAVRLRVGTP